MDRRTCTGIRSGTGLEQGPNAGDALPKDGGGQGGLTAVVDTFGVGAGVEESMHGAWVVVIGGEDEQCVAGGSGQVRRHPGAQHVNEVIRSAVSGKIEG